MENRITYLRKEYDLEFMNLMLTNPCWSFEHDNLKIEKRLFFSKIQEIRRKNIS